MLKPIPNKLDLISIDREVLEFWDTHQIFLKSIDQRKNGPDFVFYDGPPGTNGVPHVGHMMHSALKDLWPRYKTMQGYRVLRKAGWDTHGLPVEMTAERELGIKSKSEIAELGEARFIEKCREVVFHYKSLWETAIRKIGRFLDLKNAYATYHPYYIESDWWTLKQAWNLELEGEARARAESLGQSPRYLYRDYRVMAYSPRTGTALSNFEVAQGYQEVTDLTLYVKFRLKDAPNTFLTAWTTTPWTLLSNLAVAVHPEILYLVLELQEDCDSGKVGDRLIMAQARHQALEPLLGKHQVVGHMTGAQLAGTAYEPMWEWLPQDKGASMRVVCDEYVTALDGTGLVHLAYYGEDDFRILRKNGIPLFLAVNQDGRVIPEAKRFAGRWFRDETLDVDILKALKERNLLVAKEKYTHTYPFDYRTGSPLMYFPRPAWFLRMTALKDMMLEANALINWKPEHIREGRFGNWLENIGDWNLTRERYWGSPLPVWSSDDGSWSECFASIAELSARHEQDWGKPIPMDFDPHKPQIDEIKLKSALHGELRRENYVLDCWFNAGIMPWAQFGFPSRPGSQAEFRSQYPGDFISEGLDQTRGWFYTLLATSCLIAKAQWEKAKREGNREEETFWSNPRNWSSYRNVICTELVLDHQGRKMSKSLGNVVDPVALIDKFGADPVRWIFFSSNPWSVKRFGEEEIADAVRSVILPLWNSYTFFVTYARIDGWTGNQPVSIQPTVMDRWIISEYHRLVETVVKSLDDFDVAGASAAITRFLDLLTNWYIRRSRRRFWKSESDVDKATAYSTLYEVLSGLTRLLAPFLPFITETFYQNLVRGLRQNAPLSVHLTDYPQADSAARDRALEDNMERVMEAVTLARALRQERNLKVRQPLKNMLLVVPQDTESGLAPFLQILADELNVKTVELRHDDQDLVTRSATANFRSLGRRVGGKMQTVAQSIAAFTDDQIRAVEAGGTISVGEFQLSADDILIRRTEKPGLALKSDGYMTVALDTELTPDLIAEGLAREFVHHVQNGRKQAGFEITDRIELTYATSSAILAEALLAHEAYIKSETLSDQMVSSRLDGKLDARELDVNGHSVLLKLEKAVA